MTTFLIILAVIAVLIIIYAIASYNNLRTNATRLQTHGARSTYSLKKV